MFPLLLGVSCGSGGVVISLSLLRRKLNKMSSYLGGMPLYSAVLLRNKQANTWKPAAGASPALSYVPNHRSFGEKDAACLQGKISTLDFND